MAKKRFEISFAGCGFLGVYHIGVGKCVVDHAPHLFDEFEGFYGASAGAITAVCAACKSDPMIPFKWVKKTFEALRKHRLGALHPSFDLYKRLRQFLEEFLPSNAHRLCRHKVKISLTTFSGGKPQNWLVSNFNTRKELINAIIASSFIPGYAGLKSFPLIRGKRCCDGGFTSNIPCASDPNVITVSPFGGDCDICPHGESHSPYMLYVLDQSLQISFKNMNRLAKALFPTSWVELEELFYQGYQDAQRFFKIEGIIADPAIRPLRRNSTLPVITDSAIRPLRRNSTLPIVTDSAIRPLRRNSTLPVATDSAIRPPRRNSTLPVVAEPVTVEADQTSEYCSMSGESTPVSRSRSHSISLASGCDFFSCLDEDEFSECEEFQGSLLPNELTSLEEELEELAAEMERERSQGESGGRRGSMAVELAQASWQRLSQLLQTCTPSQLPLVSRVGSVTEFFKTQVEQSSESSWEKELAGHPRLFDRILSSWTSSMVAF